MTTVKSLTDVGKIFFLMSIFAIGLIHIAFANFPIGLLPVKADFTGRNGLIYVSGASLILGGALMIIKKYERQGTLLIAATFLLYLLLIYIPALFSEIKNPGNWTGMGEVLALGSGALILYGHFTHHLKTAATGTYLFALSLVIFGVQHYLYADFISTLIPAWIPGKSFWSYAVMVAFLLTSVSIFIKKFVFFMAALLGLMFLLWCVVLHAPRVVDNTQTEPEWTSFFIALAMGGISFIIAGRNDLESNPVAKNLYNIS